MAKGRPQLVFSMRPVKQSAIDLAKKDGINIDLPRVMSVMEISPTSKNNIAVVTPRVASPTATNRVTA